MFPIEVFEIMIKQELLFDLPDPLFIKPEKEDPNVKAQLIVYLDENGIIKFSSPESNKEKKVY